jgi:hypothetical protein
MFFKCFARLSSLGATSAEIQELGVDLSIDRFQVDDEDFHMSADGIAISLEPKALHVCYVCFGTVIGSSESRKSWIACGGRECL